MKTYKQEQLDAFLNEVDEVSKKHGLSISHEDCHGSFMVGKYSKDNIKWLKEAYGEGIEIIPKAPIDISSLKKYPKTKEVHPCTGCAARNNKKLCEQLPDGCGAEGIVWN